MTTLAGFDLATRVERGGELLGAMAITLPPGRPVRPAERRLIGQLAAQAALVFETLRLTSELTRHAEALAEQAAELRTFPAPAGQGAGRGTEPGSAATCMTARSSIWWRSSPRPGWPEASSPATPQLADGTLAGLQQDTKAALTEIRELVHGSLSADPGRPGAGGGGRATLRATADPGPGRRRPRADVGRRLDPSVESAAWFVISEALTNAIKHSEAELITVRIRTGDRLTVQVERRRSRHRPARHRSRRDRHAGPGGGPRR